MKKQVCSQCGGEEWIKKLRVVDRGEDNARYDLALEMEMNPQAILFKERVNAPLHADVCAGCGLVLFQVSPVSLQMLKAGKQLTEERESADAKSGDFRNHPRYQEFLAEDAAYKFMEGSEVMLAFAQWLARKER
ncbi:hypothetical protein SAMN02745181_3760 [Rubritalea squalenifaciens DSM 18772]|uniref:Uncharacterized protein n=1 Tax=Rubritalea squalenifaciens DSM 18772 TaxID=1123071 RepID=A0A1M6S9E0_9BACT|nr:hypothetical protein [Rubritalea squalenifaciens]SHK41383.1 hypothetical protein SAMN02745181_3760 [Rubritalea squalenifaciens DSM 18772]